MKNKTSHKFRKFQISSIFRIFLALLLKISRHFVISRPFLWNSGNFFLFPFFHFIPANFHQNFTKKSQNPPKNANEMKWNCFIPPKKNDVFLLKFWDLSGAKVWKSCRSRKSWKNEYLVAIVAVDTAENEPLKVWAWFHSFFIRLINWTLLFKC